MAINTNYQPNVVDNSKGRASSGKIVDLSNGSDCSQVLEGLQSTNEQLLKASMQLIQTKANSLSPQDLSPELQEALAGDPCWSAATSSKPTPVKPQEIGNFFMIVAKYMQDHTQSDDQIEVCQAVNMVCQNNLLDNLTTSAMTSLSSTESQVSNLDSEASDALKLGLIIGICGAIAAGALCGGGGALLGAAASTALSIGVGVAAAGMSVAAGVTSDYANQDVTEASGDSANMQAEMAVNSAASGNVQNTLKEDMQNQQNSMSDLQATLSMLLQMVQAETTVFKLGTI